MLKALQWTVSVAYTLRIALSLNITDKTQTLYFLSDFYLNENEWTYYINTVTTFIVYTLNCFFCIIKVLVSIFKDTK